jgi:hypothetical protein
VRGFLKTVVIAAAGSTTAAAVSFATSHGPLPAHTGAFGEPTCQRCHSDYPLNDGAADIRLNSIPLLYDTRTVYSLQLRVQHPELKRAGFQMSARFEDGSQAGSWIRTARDTVFTRVQEAGGIDYVSHTEAGTMRVRGDTALWVVKWESPTTNQRVVFSVAVNVSNYDASEFGDRIFTRSFLRDAGEPVRK